MTERRQQAGRGAGVGKEELTKKKKRLSFLSLLAAIAPSDFQEEPQDSSERITLRFFCEDKEIVCAEAGRLPSVTHGCSARISHLRQIATHVRITHAGEAIHKFSVKPL